MSNETSYQGTYVGETVKERLLNKSSIYEKYDLSANSSINVPILEEDDSSSQILLFGEFNEFPDIDIPIILKNTLKISFDKDIKEEMFENTSFRKYITEIENTLYLFKEEYGLAFNAKISFQQDWEIEELRNIILLIKFYNISFEEELKLWKNLSSFVRKGLQLTEDYMGSKELVKDFINYNNIFYIKLDLT